MINNITPVVNKSKNLEYWLKIHKVKKVGDKVFDKTGIITSISMGLIHHIEIRPINQNHNLGNGYGNIVNIYF
jgi:hypothetical protein